MSRIDRTISPSESEISTSSESREETHSIKEIECEKPEEQPVEQPPKKIGDPMKRRQVSYWSERKANQEDRSNRVVQWLRDNGRYQELQENGGFEREIIQPRRVIQRQEVPVIQWPVALPGGRIEYPKPIRVTPRINDEVVQTRHNMIPRRSENVTLEMRLRNVRPEVDELRHDDGILYEIVPPRPVDIPYEEWYRINKK